MVIVMIHGCYVGRYLELWSCCLRGVTVGVIHYPIRMDVIGGLICRPDQVALLVANVGL